MLALPYLNDDVEKTVRHYTAVKTRMMSKLKTESTSVTLISLSDLWHVVISQEGGAVLRVPHLIIITIIINNIRW